MLVPDDPRSGPHCQDLFSIPQTTTGMTTSTTVLNRHNKSFSSSDIKIFTQENDTKSPETEELYIKSNRGYRK